MPRFVWILLLGLSALLLGGASLPVGDDKDHCDDCVIVSAPADRPDPAPGSKAGSASSVLAGTLWGLFIVSRRPKLRA